MYELPLFPLNMVLFPGSPVNLHVFEPRYKEMVGRCLEFDQPFGIVLIREGMATVGPLPDPHPIGCTARIASVEPSSDGNIDLVAVGVDRFRIESVRRDGGRPYLVGDVEAWPLPNGDRTVVARAEGRLRRWLERYLAVLVRASEGGFAFTSDQLPADAAALGFLAASILPLPARQKQPLLASGSLADLLETATTLYRTELALLENMVEHRDVDQPGPFSRN
jgi:uncharacterized protein